MTDSNLNAARRGLLKAIWQSTFAPRFSSIPIDLKTSGVNPSVSAFSSNPIEVSLTLATAGSFVRQNSFTTTGTQDTNTDGSIIGLKRTDSFQRPLRESSNLTPSEQGYLQELLQSDDLESIIKASDRLSDRDVFPTAIDSDDELDSTKEKPSKVVTVAKRKIISLPPKVVPQRRRDSHVQEQLLEWHEKTTIMPSAVLRRVSSNQSAKKAPPLSTGSRTISLNHSLTHDDNYDACSIAPSGTCESIRGDESVLQQMSSTESLKKKDALLTDKHQKDPVITKNAGDLMKDDQTWNSDVSNLNSWITRREGAELDEDGHASASTHAVSDTFKIIGTSANDKSCQPMVLSPPLMEGLQLFMPESLHKQHYWLKYSLVRDGPGLMKMLRHCRASQHTILAIESTDGHVFGSFTSQPWRLMRQSTGTNLYFGSKESFVWRMRESRFKPCKSVVEQLLMESKIDVFPFTSQNNNVQTCTTGGVALGYGEIKDECVMNLGHDKNSEDIQNHIGTTDFFSYRDNHYEHAIKLDKSMAAGSTSSSETFGSPCLIKRQSRGEKFEVANVELWAMTPHDSVQDANQAEMRTLFLEDNIHRLCSQMFTKIH